MGLRIVSGIMLPMFLMSVAVQYNDPDGPVWMLIYGFPAALALAALLGHISPSAIVGSFVYMAGGLLLMPWSHLADLPNYVSTWHMTTFDSEYAREAIGLFICAAYFDFLTVLWFLRRRTATQGA